MRSILIGLIVLASYPVANAEDMVYEGTWVTSNRPLDGRLACVVIDLGGNRWRGHFSGDWNGAQFQYTVHFSGLPERLQGTAVIDGANYQWTGAMSKQPSGPFRGTFGGDRYEGTFNLRRKGK